MHTATGRLEFQVHQTRTDIGAGRWPPSHQLVDCTLLVAARCLVAVLVTLERCIYD